MYRIDKGEGKIRNQRMSIIQERERSECFGEKNGKRLGELNNFMYGI